MRVGTHTNKKFLEFEGKTYIQESTDLFNTNSRNKAETKLSFKQFNLKEYDELIDKVASKLINKTDVKQILIQALRDLPIDDIKKIEKEMEKDNPTIRKEKGCVRLRVAGVSIPIRD